MDKKSLPIAGLFSSLLISCADKGYGPGWGRGHMMYYGYGGMFMWVILLIVLALFIYYAVSKSNRKGPETPLAILRSRYAKGEISKEEFERMKKDIGES